MRKFLAVSNDSNGATNELITLALVYCDKCIMYVVKL